VVDSPENSRDDIAVLAGTIGTQNGYRHNPHTRITDACNPFAVVSLGGNDACHPCTVAVGISLAI